MRSSLDASCSRFAVRSAGLICPQSKRHASHRDAATAFKEKIMSVVALDTDLLRVAGYQLPRSDPSDRMRGWKSATEALEKMRNDLEAQLGEKLFLIADARDRASEISFYLHDKRVEGPGHPPVYIPESQDMVNQFSFWPRYDRIHRAKTWHATAGRRGLHRRERHQFVRRTRCAFYQGWRKGTCTSQHTGGISIH